MRKRPAFRTAFADFSIPAVAGFDDDDVRRLLLDAGIVRNRAKIEATISNAARGAGPAGWSARASSRGLRRPAGDARPGSLGEIPSVSDESTALAKELKRHGVRFVGPTTAYALMQATGLVNDHLAKCWCR